MKRIPMTAAAVLMLALAGCANGVSAPTAIQALPPAHLASLHVSDISVDAADGVEAGDTDFDLIAAKVKGYLQLGAPVTIATGGAADKMAIHLTKFDRGNAAARALLIGLGQIRIEATVSFIDPSGQQVGQYAVSKDFAFGGIYGAVTSVEDVEDGFAKSIVEIVKAKA